MIGEELARLMKNMLVEPPPQIDDHIDADPPHQDVGDVFGKASDCREHHEERCYDRPRIGSFRQVTMHIQPGKSMLRAVAGQQIYDGFEERCPPGFEHADQRHQKERQSKQTGVGPYVLQQYAEIFHQINDRNDSPVR